MWPLNRNSVQMPRQTVAFGVHRTGYAVRLGGRPLVGSSTAPLCLWQLRKDLCLDHESHISLAFRGQSLATQCDPGACQGTRGHATYIERYATGTGMRDEWPREW